MAPFLTIFLLVTFIVSSHYSASVLADTQPFELYNSSDTGISILTTANFNSTIFKGKTDNGQLSSGNRIWFVQFYNTWCGHCQHFAPTWKSLANTTLGWSKNFALAVVDCSKRENAPVCNHYSVSSYPSMKFFPPGMKVGADAVSYVGPHTETGVYLGILDYMDKIKFPEEIASVAAKSLSDLWTALPADVEDLALIVEPPDSKLGRAVVLSTAGNIFTPGFTVQRVTTLNAELLQSIGDNLEDAFPRLWLLYRSGKKTRIVLPAGRDNDAAAFIDSIFSLDDSLILAKKLPKPVRDKVHYLAQETPKNGASADQDAKKPAKVHTKRPSDVIPANMTDLVSAMIYMFSVEVPTHKSIDGEKHTALKNFIHSVTVLIPFPPPTLTALQKLATMLQTDSTTNPTKIKQVLKDASFDAENLATTWIGCKGSVPGRRGYPCSLWQLFHTMTVFSFENEAKNTDISRNALDKNSGVLAAIFGYVKHFFSCQECADNFMRDAEDLATQTANLSNRDAVLWLWRIHNGVNRRLAGDITEDDGHPKVQFPSVEKCPQCRLRGSSGDVVRWQDDKVVEFLRGFYGLTPSMDEPGALNVRDPTHRQKAMSSSLEDEVSGAVSSRESASHVKLYIAVVVFLAGALAGWKQLIRWRNRPIKWSFNYSKTRVKWM